MPVRIGSGLSELPDARAAAIEAAVEARAGLGGARADVVLLFVCGDHVGAAEAVLDGVREALDPAALAGCGAGGVLVDGHEVEGGPAVSVWAASLDGGSAQTFRAEVTRDDDVIAVTGLPDATGASGVVLLPDPVSFPTEAALEAMNEAAPGVPLLGGLASAQVSEEGCLLFHDDEVLVGGAVGVRFDGCELLPCVSQGAAPIGPELLVTASEGPVVTELDGTPAIQALQDVVDGLGAGERALVAQGVLLGIEIDARTPGAPPGDFLVRGLVGADPAAGSIVVGTEVAPGTVVRLHARDADSADRDLRDALALRRTALGAERPAGALMFTCNGRGVDLFGERHHDALAITDELGVPAAGFFAAGEIGPVGGKPFMHGFTATVAVFAR